MHIDSLHPGTRCTPKDGPPTPPHWQMGDDVEMAPRGWHSRAMDEFNYAVRGSGPTVRVAVWLWAHRRSLRGPATILFNIKVTRTRASG